MTAFSPWGPLGAQRHGECSRMFALAMASPDRGQEGHSGTARKSGRWRGQDGPRFERAAGRLAGLFAVGQRWRGLRPIAVVSVRSCQS